MVIDDDVCSGHGRCYVLAPTLFTDDDRGYGQVVNGGTFGADERSAAERAVGGCPEHAITIVDD